MEASAKRLAVVVAVAASVAVLAPTANAKPKPTCAAKHSRTVASTKQVRVYSLKHLDGFALVYFGCDRRTGRRTTIGDAITNGLEHVYISRPEIAGRFVALEQHDDGGGGPATALYQADLARRRRTTLDNSDSNPVGPTPQLGAFYLTAQGGVAWLDGTALFARLFHAHKNVTLDAGPVSQVALHGRKLTWSSGGTPHTADLG